MAEFSVPTHGTICWHELASRDLEAAKAFYKEMFGWELAKSKVSPVAYDEIHIGGRAVGGMMAIDESWGPEPPPRTGRLISPWITPTRPLKRSRRTAERLTTARSMLRELAASFFAPTRAEHILL